MQRVEEVKRVEVVESIQKNLNHILFWIGIILLIVFGIRSCRNSFREGSADNGEKNVQQVQISQEFQYLKNIWAAPPNPVGGTWKIVVSYHDQNTLVFSHQQKTEIINPVNIGGFGFSVGRQKEGDVGYTVDLQNRRGTWSQKYIKEGGTLVVTAIQDDKIFVDQFWKGELLNQFVITKS